MMTETKTPPRCTTTGTAKKQSIAKSSNCILSLTRTAVKLAITADLVLLLAALGSLNIPGIVCTVLVLNALCGLILKQEENIHENV
jgi:hypothetical protein